MGPSAQVGVPTLCTLSCSQMELPGAPSPSERGLPPQGLWTHFLSAVPRKISQGVTGQQGRLEVDAPVQGPAVSPLWVSPRPGLLAARGLSPHPVSTHGLPAAALGRHESSASVVHGWISAWTLGSASRSHGHPVSPSQDTSHFHR